MTEIGGLHGGKAPEPKGPKRKKPVDAEKFRKIMKVEKGHEVDPEEKRGRKPQAETEEEIRSIQKSPSSQQGRAPSKAPSPYTPTPPSTPQKPPSPSTPTPSTLGAPTPEPTDEEMAAPPIEGYENEEPTSLASSPSPAPTPTTTTSAPRPPSQPSAPPPPQAEIEEPTQPESTTSHTQPTGTSSSSTEASGESAEETTTPPPTEELPEDLLAVLTEGAETEAATPGKWTFQKGEKGEKIEREASDAEEEDEVPLFSSGLPQGSWEAQEHKDETEKKIEEEGIKTVEEGGVPLDIQLALGQPAETVAPTAPVASPYAQLPPHVMALFERMVGVMTVIQETGVTETTINLNNPEQAKSPFFGSQIVIREFSSAPKQFNIEMLGTPQSTPIFTGHVNELVAAFQAGNYNFKVNRIDIGYLPEKREERVRKEQRIQRKQPGGDTL